MWPAPRTAAVPPRCSRFPLTRLHFPAVDSSALNPGAPSALFLTPPLPLLFLHGLQLPSLSKRARRVPPGSLTSIFPLRKMEQVSFNSCEARPSKRFSLSRARGPASQAFVFQPGRSQRGRRPSAEPAPRVPAWSPAVKRERPRHLLHGVTWGPSADA